MCGDFGDPGTIFTFTEGTELFVECEFAVSDDDVCFAEVVTAGVGAGVGKNEEIGFDESFSAPVAVVAGAVGGFGCPLSDEADLVGDSSDQAFGVIAVTSSNSSSSSSEMVDNVLVTKAWARSRAAISSDSLEVHEGVRETCCTTTKKKKKKKKKKINIRRLKMKPMKYTDGLFQCSLNGKTKN
jgi:hypothetical protein